MKLISSAEVGRIRAKHTELEVKVAKSIEECIDRYCGVPLRQAIQQLLVEICDIPKEVEVPSGENLKDPLMEYLGHEHKNFAMFVRSENPVQPNRGGLEKLRDGKILLDLSTCSDVIRLFGELCEQKDCWKLTGSKWRQNFKWKEDLKPRPTFLKPEEETDWRPDYASDARRLGLGTEALAKYNKELKGKFKDPKAGQQLLRDRQELGFGHRARIDLPRDKVKVSGMPYVQIPSQISRGVDKFQLGEKSVIGVLDKTFGLEIKGADVSGTTTDSIFALKYALEKPSVFDIGLAMLLPVATMVQAGHHALLECAYPLSRWGYIDYKIGYYNSLVPLPEKCSKESLAALQSALGKFKNDADQLHVLVYRSGDQESGLLMEGKEIELFEPVAKLLNAYGWCVTGPVDPKMVIRVFQSFSKKLLDTLPTGWDSSVVESIFAKRYAQERGLSLPSDD